jgi:hypothetical protein
MSETRKPTYGYYETATDLGDSVMTAQRVPDAPQVDPDAGLDLHPGFMESLRQQAERVAAGDKGTPLAEVEVDQAALFKAFMVTYRARMACEALTHPWDDWYLHELDTMLCRMRNEMDYPTLHLAHKYERRMRRQTHG